MAIQRLPVYLLFASLMVTPPLYAHLPELYGRDYLRVFDPETFQPPQRIMRQRVYSLTDTTEREYQEHLNNQTSVTNTSPPIDSNY